MSIINVLIYRRKRRKCQAQRQVTAHSPSRNDRPDQVGLVQPKTAASFKPKASLSLGQQGVAVPHRKPMNVDAIIAKQRESPNSEPPGQKMQ